MIETIIIVLRNEETNGKMQELKGSVVDGWEKRKKLKQSIQEMSQQKQVLNAALNRFAPPHAAAVN